MSIINNRLSEAEYIANFSDIHPPFGTADGALVEVNGSTGQVTVIEVPA